MEAIWFESSGMTENVTDIHCFRQSFLNDLYLWAWNTLKYWRTLTTLEEIWNQIHFGCLQYGVSSLKILSVICICTNICQCCALLPRGNLCPSEQLIDKDGDSSYVFNFPASCWSIGQSMGESVALLKMTSESSVLDAFDHDYCYNHDQWPQSWPLLWVTRMMAFEYGLEKVID